MIELKTRLRKWGNSFGVVVPVKEIKEEDIKEGEELTVILMKENNVFKETFGTLKIKKKTDEIMKEIDKELDIEF